MMVFAKVALRITDCLHSSTGLFTLFGCLALSYISGYEGMLFLLLFCTVFDAFWGVVVSLKLGKFARSDLFRQTVVKLAAYGTVMFVFIGIERILHIETVLPTAAIVSIISVCELWSICGNILIVNPNIPILSLLRSVLKGEIARKLGISESEVSDVLDKKTTIDATKTTNIK